MSSEQLGPPAMVGLLSGRFLNEGGSPASLREIHTCWNEIGVYGNRNCEQLPKVVHCRNCPAYSQAAQQLLDRPLPAEYRAHWSAHFARREEATEPGRTSAVLFRMSSEWFALPTFSFQEVAEKRPIHSLPHRAKGALLGLANVRGELLVCISLSDFLGSDGPHQCKPRFDYHRLLVAHSEDARFVFPVDEVHGIFRFPQNRLQEPPPTLTRSSVSYTCGVFQWRDQMVGLLDPDRLFSAITENLL